MIGRTTKEISILHQNYRSYDNVVWFRADELQKEIEKFTDNLENAEGSDYGITKWFNGLCNSQEQKVYSSVQNPENDFSLVLSSEVHPNTLKIVNHLFPKKKCTCRNEVEKKFGKMNGCVDCGRCGGEL